MRQGVAGAARGGDDGRGSREDALTFTGLIALALVAIGVVVIVAAVVFRRGWAIRALHVLRRVGWGYVIGILVLAGMHIWRNGGL